MSRIDAELVRRKRLADLYYDNYRKYLEERKFQKASEFLWGALANILYAITLKRYGIKLGKHRQFRDVVNRISLELNDPEIARIYVESAEIIHANFYHDFMDEVSFRWHAKNVERLIFKLVKLL
ncbi:PaREP1 family protein [Archaeoglobus sp.]